MSDIKVRSDRHNQTVHTASISEPELFKLAVAAVADKVGLNPNAIGVKVKVHATTYTEGSLGTSKPRIEVSITVDHEPQPAEEPKPPEGGSV